MFPYVVHHCPPFTCAMCKQLTLSLDCVYVCCSTIYVSFHVCPVHLLSVERQCSAVCSGGAAAAEGRRGRSVRLFTRSVLLCVQVEQQRQKDAADGLFVCSPGLFCCVFRWSSSGRRTPRTVCSSVHPVCSAVCSGGAAAAEGRRGRSVRLFTRSVLLCVQVEQQRQKDAADGLPIAAALNGFVRRKVIKQTVMTTVYGVTRYGARLQIAKQLKGGQTAAESEGGLFLRQGQQAVLAFPSESIPCYGQTSYLLLGPQGAQKYVI